MPRRVLCRSGIAGPTMGCGSRGAAACGGTGPAPSALPKTTLSACTVDGLLAECGNVWVPQDWAHPDGPVMPLQVVVLPAATTRHPAAPLLYLTGLGAQAAGDGDSVLNGMSWAAQAFQQLNQTIAVGHILTVGIILTSRDLIPPRVRSCRPAISARSVPARTSTTSCSSSFRVHSSSRVHWAPALATRSPSIAGGWPGESVVIGRIPGIARRRTEREWPYCHL